MYYNHLYNNWWDLNEIMFNCDKENDDEDTHYHVYDISNAL